MSEKKQNEVIAWTVALEGRPCPFYVRHLRKDAIEAFNDNIVDKTQTLKDYSLYKPVKIAIRVIK